MSNPFLARAKQFGLQADGSGGRARPESIALPPPPPGYNASVAFASKPTNTTTPAATASTTHTPMVVETMKDTQPSLPSPPTSQSAGVSPSFHPPAGQAGPSNRSPSSSGHLVHA